MASLTDVAPVLILATGASMRRPAQTSCGNIRLMVGSIVSGAELSEELRRSLRPVGFGAAYKVLDMLWSTHCAPTALPAAA